MPAFAATVKRHAVYYQANVYRLGSVPGDKYPILYKDAFRLPVNNLAVETGVKVTAGFVVR